MSSSIFLAFALLLSTATAHPADQNHCADPSQSSNTPADADAEAPVPLDLFLLAAIPTIAVISVIDKYRKRSKRGGSGNGNGRWACGETWTKSRDWESKRRLLEGFVVGEWVFGKPALINLRPKVRHLEET